MPPAPRLSACLIVQDEQRRLPAALASVAFCDEVVVVDGGSRDDTVAIARAAGARVIESPWPGFAAQRNLALDAAGGDWVLELDADERVSARLRASIEELLHMAAAGCGAPAVAVFGVRNRFLGGDLGPSAKYPSYRTRLFRRDAYRHDEGRTVHEGIEPHERPAVLDGDLHHELAGSLQEALGDAWRYALLESRHVQAGRNPAAYAFGIALRPAAKVAYRTIVDGGWRDGWRGLFKILLDACSDSLVWALALVRALGVAGGGPGGSSPVPAPPPAGHFGRRPAGPPKVVAIAARGSSAQAARRWLAAAQRHGADVMLICDEPAQRDAGRPAPAERQVPSEQQMPAERQAPAEQHVPAEQQVPVRRVRRVGPLATMRALDVEMQIRTIHAVVAFGPRARLIRRVLPGALRPALDGLQADRDPARAVEPASD